MKIDVFYTLGCFVAGIVVLSACSVMENGRELKKISLNQGFILNQEELGDLKMQADNGSASAARRIYIYYTLGDFDQKLSLFWLKKSAELGDKKSQAELDNLK